MEHDARRIEISRLREENEQLQASRPLDTTPLHLEDARRKIADLENTNRELLETLERKDRQLITARRELLRAADVSDLLGVSTTQLQNYRHDGRIPEPITLSKQCVVWRHRELRDWVNAGCPPACAWHWYPSQLQTLQEMINERQGQLNSQS